MNNVFRVFPRIAVCNKRRETCKQFLAVFDVIYYKVLFGCEPLRMLKLTSEEQNKEEKSQLNLVAMC